MVTVEIIENHNKGTEVKYPELTIKQSWNPTGDPLIAVSHTHKTGNPFYKIYKIQFLALCSTSMNHDVVAAFYFGEKSELQAQILSELPGDHSVIDNFLVFDYKAYKDLCSVTGERYMNIEKYIASLRKGDLKPNSFMFDGPTAYNADQQDNY